MRLKMLRRLGEKHVVKRTAEMAVLRLYGVNYRLRYFPEIKRIEITAYGKKRSKSIFSVENMKGFGLDNLLSILHVE